MDRVGDDFARGHKEATGGIIPKVMCIQDITLTQQEEFDHLVASMGIDTTGKTKTSSPSTLKSNTANTQNIKDFFKAVPR
jgi:hypothetical protein